MINATFKDVTVQVGDTVRVKNTIVEGTKSRVQSFEGMIIAMHGRGENKTVTIRRISPGGIGVERIWPVNTPSIVGIEVVKRPVKVRRSKLYYLREVKGRAASRI